VTDHGNKLSPSIDAERKRRQRARKRAAGLNQYEIWLLPGESPLVQKFVKRLRSRKTNMGAQHERTKP
jgi:hypothetical protein